MQYSIRFGIAFFLICGPVCSAMSLTPHQITLYDQSASDDIQAIFGMTLPSGYAIADHEVDFVLDGEFIARSISLDYCAIDDNLMVNFDRDTVQTHPGTILLAGCETIATVSGWFEIENSTGDVQRLTLWGQDLFTILSYKIPMEITQSNSAPPGDDVLLGYDTVDQDKDNFLLWDRGQGTETCFGQTFRLNRAARLEKITLKLRPDQVDISGQPVELWLGYGYHHITDSRISTLIANPKADLPEGLDGGDPVYLTFDFDDLYLNAERDYAFMLRFASGGSGQGQGLAAYVWAMGHYVYADGAAFIYSGNWPGTLLNNELVFFVHGRLLERSPLMGDLSLDYRVDLDDLRELASNWLNECEDCRQLDINLDGMIDTIDLRYLVRNWLAEYEN